MSHAVVRFLLRLLYRVEVSGSMGAHPKLLIVANHQSFLDVLILGAFLPVEPHWLVHTTIASLWYFRIILKFFPHLVVDTSRPLAIKAAAAVIEAGKPLLIFPEGRITVTGALMKIYEGPAFVAAWTGATVVPIHIDGAVYSPFSRMSGDFPRRWFPKIRLTILPPRTLPMPQARTAKLRRKIAAQGLRRMMQESELAARRQRSIFDALLDAISVHGRGRRMIEDLRMEEWSYGRFLKASLALGRIVSKISREGENVGVLMPNASATVALLFGMFAMRRVPAMLNYSAGPEGMQSACRTAGLRTVVTSRAFLEKARLTAVVEGLRDVRVLYLEDLRAAFGLSDKLWLACWAMWFPRRVARRPQPAEPAAILFTSGSEGKPKGVVLSHDSLLVNIAQIRAVIEVTCKDKLLGALPLFHAFGLLAGGILPLVSGARVFLYPSPLHYRMVPEMIYDRDCTIVFATGTFLGKYGVAAHPFDLRSARLVVAGAEKLAEDVRQLYSEKFGARILEAYGVTECSPGVSISTPVACQSGSVGELLPGMECRIEPVEGIEEGGLLHVRGPNLMLGYMLPDCPGVIQPPSSLFGPGWHNTGDIVSIDESGFLTIRGRMRRFAKVAGEMVSLEQVEAIAAAASPGRQHGSAAYRDVRRGEVVVLFTDDPALARERLVEAARRLGASDLAIPRRVILLDKLPLLGSGKKDYVTLSRMADQWREQAVGRA